VRLFRRAFLRLTGMPLRAWRVGRLPIRGRRATGPVQGRRLAEVVRDAVITETNTRKGSGK
jgi:hypothetical protein